MILQGQNTPFPPLEVWVRAACYLVLHSPDVPCFMWATCGPLKVGVQPGPYSGVVNQSAEAAR